VLQVCSETCLETSNCDAQNIHTCTYILQVCNETCLETSDFDSRDMALLSKVSMEDARQMLKAVKIRLSKVRSWQTEIIYSVFWGLTHFMKLPYPTCVSHTCVPQQSKERLYFDLFCVLLVK
jgi:hypothetical protein